MLEMVLAFGLVAFAASCGMSMGQALCDRDFDSSRRNRSRIVRMLRLHPLYFFARWLLQEDPC